MAPLPDPLCVTVDGGRLNVTDHHDHRDRPSSQGGPRTWGVHGIDGPIRAIVDLTVEPLTETRSRLTIAVDFEGHGIGRILVPLLVRREAEKEMPANLATLKQRLETRPG